MKAEEYVKYDGIGLAELIKKGEVSLSEVTEAATAAINATNPEILAVVENWEGVTPAEARKDSLLYGVPFLIKDLGVVMNGKKNELGSKLAEGFTPDFDSTLMTHFKHAGLVTLGRTATPEFAISTTTEARAVGPSRNPWNTDYNCGGSTGGSASAVAAGMVPLSHATDGGGSIRVPASVNGIFGLKPTRGRVSNGPHLDEVWSGLVSQLGVSRTVRDSAAMLDAISIPGVGEPYYTAPPAESFLTSVDKDPKPLRIGLMMDPANGAKTCAVVAESVARTARLLEGLGHQVEAVKFDLGVSWEAFVHANAQFWTLNTASWVELIAELTGRPINVETLEQATLAVHEYGKNVSGMDVLGALGTRNIVSRSLGAYFQNFDILMTPTMPELPLKIGEYNKVQNQVDGLGWIEHVFKQSPFTALANLTGVPSMSVPSGYDKQTQLPIGAMYTAQFGDDSALFSLAGQIERAAPWNTRTPKVWAGRS
ncbi:amidase [Hahella sp. NBU794]|uniref:amidase n=1 Tax=Hahella sp. NBU794 TaxID=3422590 RepID=UPI003D70033C